MCGEHLIGLQTADAGRLGIFSNIIYNIISASVIKWRKGRLMDGEGWLICMIGMIQATLVVVVVVKGFVANASTHTEIRVSAYKIDINSNKSY